MGKKLKLQYEKFIKHYCVYFNATEAAVHAGYSKRSAHDTGYTLLRKPEIRDRINEICERQDETTLATKTYIVNKMKEVLEVDIVQYTVLGRQGCTQEQLDEMPLAVRKMITQVERKDFYERDLDGKNIITHSVYKFKLMSKDKMAELLAKHTGATKDGPLVENNNTNQMTYGELLDQSEKECD